MVIIRPVKKGNLEENVSIALVSKDIFTTYGVIQETIQNIVLNVTGEVKVHEIVSSEVLVKCKHYFRSSKYVCSLATVIQRKQHSRAILAVFYCTNGTKLRSNIRSLKGDDLGCFLMLSAPDRSLLFRETQGRYFFTIQTSALLVEQLFLSRLPQ